MISILIGLGLGLLENQSWAQVLSDVSGTFHFQTTVVTQDHPDFASPYQGKNSLIPQEGAQTSQTLTFFGGLDGGSWGEFYLDGELAGGRGLSQTLGVAGYPNGEIYRVGDPTPVWNMARFYYKKVWGWGTNPEQEKMEEDLHQVARSYSVDRVKMVLGKFALNDFFDNNSYSHDPRSQFLNWALMDMGAWDYAADTKGYSWGLLLEWHRKDWAIRWARVLEPENANDNEMDLRVDQAHGDNLELEWNWDWKSQPGALRFLAFENHAHMGNYKLALKDPHVDITQTRNYSEKHGFGVGLEQKWNSDLGFFSRVSWNDGQTETWAFTEIDQSLSAGFSWKPHWMTQKGEDTLGGALILNDISAAHRGYLAAGGYGFLIGDGQLGHYSSEKIFETYYLFHPLKEGTLSLDYQLIMDPAYNSDRGPVSIYGLRLHYEI